MQAYYIAHKDDQRLASLETNLDKLSTDGRKNMDANARKQLTMAITDLTVLTIEDLDVALMTPAVAAKHVIWSNFEADIVISDETPRGTEA